MPSYPIVQMKTFIKGVSLSSDLFNQPRGSVPRASNLILTKRGALKACDGTAIVEAFGGAPVAGRGRLTSAILFQPIGVNPYYLLIGEALDIPLGPPKNLTVTAGGAGGTLAAGTYFYVVTALDGVGGETTISNEVSYTVAANNKIILTWNTVPNAQGYNIYRSNSTGTEVLLAASTLPVGPIVINTLTGTWTDDGSATVVAPTYNIDTILSVYNSFYHTSQFFYTLTAATSGYSLIGRKILIAGVTPATIDGTFIAESVSGMVVQALPVSGNYPGGTGGTLTVEIQPPTSDTTQQLALYITPSSGLGSSYTNDDIVALFPADARPLPPTPGGSGGGGTSGGGTSGSAGATASGGYPPGNCSNIPQMVQYLNQIILALGNGVPPQIYADATGTPQNPATSVAITAISVDANGVVTITAPGHGLLSSQAGGNVILAGVGLPGYDGTFVTIEVTTGGTIKVRNLAAIGLAASSGGTLTVSATPLMSTFTAAYPNWSASTTHLVGDIVQPASPNGFYYTYTQAGISGATAPTFPTVIGQEVADGTAILTCTAATQANAPPPPGAGHAIIFAGVLWLLNTYPNDSTSGLDGPTCLRACVDGDPNSWNPINQAFLDKDDGYEGTGLAAFTITAVGIPPEGSLVAFKNMATYQIIGVFGAENFAIQRIKSDMGCIAPRTIQFIPGFGIGRMSHLGIAVFDGVEDRLISEDIRPYLFPTNDPDYDDITVMDSNWASVSWAMQTANPPMYICAIPIGSSGGQLTRLLCYDLVLKGWAIVDLPFPISTMYQARPLGSNPISLLGSFSDGTFQRWQAGDLQWATSQAGSTVAAPVTCSARCPEIYNLFPFQPQTGRLYCRQLVIRGKVVDPAAAITATLNIQEEGELPAWINNISIGSDGSFELVISVNDKFINAHAVLTSIGAIEIDSFAWFVKPETSTVPAVVT